LESIGTYDDKVDDLVESDILGDQDDPDGIEFVWERGGEFGKGDDVIQGDTLGRFNGTDDDKLDGLTEGDVILGNQLL